MAEEKPEELFPEEFASKPDEEIAVLLATAPVGTEIHNSGMHKKIIYEPVGGPARIERIGVMAFDRLIALNAHPEQLETCALMIEGGVRRMPGLWDTERARDLLNYAKDAEKTNWGNELEARKKRLVGLRFYEGGMVYHEGGYFEDARKMHLEAADMAASPAERANSLYMAAYEDLNLIIADERFGRNPEDLTDGVRALRLAGERVIVESFEAKNPNASRWRGNVLCHVGRGFIFGILNQALTKNLRNVAKMLADIPDIVEELKGINDPKDKAAVEDGLRWCQAGFAILWGNTQDFSACVESILASKGAAADWRAEALLLKAYQAKHLLRPNFRQLLREVADFGKTSHGGHVAQAIARRLLRELAEE